jgi:hypothetical protein
MARTRKPQLQSPEHPAGSEVLGIVLIVSAIFLIFAFFRTNQTLHPAIKSASSGMCSPISFAPPWVKCATSCLLC